jgi:preprotein translocase subunit SecE
MNTQTEASISVFDVVKQVFSVVLVIAGIAAFYYFADFRLLYRILGLIAVIGASVGMLATTAWGASIAGFIADSKIEVSLNDVSVKFINLDNLKKNKLASGRLQDLADLEKLQDE